MSHITHPVSTETALQLVANRQRRSVLTLLIESESTTVELGVIVEYVALENPPPEADGTVTTDRVRIGLRHNHLPKLEAAGIVEVDDRSETVRYHSNERVEKLHRFVTTELE